MSDDEFRKMMEELTGRPFPTMPAGLGEAMLKGIITSSKTLRTIYEEHTNNGFTDDQALMLVLAVQREVIGALAKILPEIAKIGYQMHEDDRRRREGD